MIEHANNLHTINKEMQVHTNKTDSITQEVRIHCSIISTLQDNTASKFKDMFAKIDKKMQDVLNFKAQIQDVLKLEIKVNNVLKFEQKVKDYLKLEQKVNDIMNFELRMKEILKLEEKVIDVLKLSPVVHSIESRVCNRYLCHIQLAHSAPVGRGSIIATFSEVREYYGNCFNQTTGKFVAPQDGLYLLCLTLQQCADKQIRVGIYVGEKCSQTVQVTYAGTSASGSVVVDIKKGQSIYLHVDFADQGAKLSSLSSFTIVSL
ncbi:heavy metal-binding protein HIP-like [Physella acuta]|uniref:heavy metal-binding protein HIP-like n=1 Tax=Physella acuta TaxID=109671 RepID=UPI0027DB4E2B|nr:heavy metal-binding protein HIP-like [Physella acuta]